MFKWLNGLLITMAMYSSIPMPRIDWNEKSMRWTMAWFPFVGVLTGAGWLGIIWLHASTGRPGIGLTTVILLLWPILISGGLHLDGFADTADAIGSHRDREERLRIMKDPHAGPFAVIALICLMLVQAACLLDLVSRNRAAGSSPQIDLAFWLQLAMIPILSRILSGLGVAVLPPARKDGLVRTFRDRLSGGARYVLIVELFITAGLWIWLDPPRALISLLVAFLVFALYARMAMRSFGGTTGDLAGFYLIVCETMLLVVQAIMR